MSERIKVEIRDPRNWKGEGLTRTFTKDETLPARSIVMSRAATVEEVAAALCVTSHHGLTRTDWPCAYHRTRAKKLLADLRGKRLVIQREGPGHGR